MAGETPSSQPLQPPTADSDHSVSAPEQSQLFTTPPPACPESSGIAADDVKNPLELADELTEKGSFALKERDFDEATEFFSRALEIRVAHFGELAPECVTAYYKYGSALLYKAQEEADPLAAMPKKDAGSQQDSGKGLPVESDVRGESSITTESSDIELNTSAEQPQGALDDGSGENNGKDKDEAENEAEDEGGDKAGDEVGDEDEGDGSDADDLGEADEDESDLDLAWKMLDLARAIAEKQSGDTMEKVDILSALAEVALEREDIETSLSDYLKALSILESLVEPDHRYIAELNFRICLCLEIGSKAQEAIPYCQKAISICKSRVQRLTDEMNSSSGSTSTAAVSEVNHDVNQSSVVSLSNSPGSDKQGEIETLTGLASELEKKLEDLQQMVANPKSILSDIMGMMLAKQKGGECSMAPSASASSSRIAIADSNGSFDSPTTSTAHTNGTPGVTHLGVVGRGVKRVGTSSADVEASPAKRAAVDAKDEGNSS